MSDDKNIELFFENWDFPKDESKKVETYKAFAWSPASGDTEIEIEFEEWTHNFPVPDYAAPSSEILPSSPFSKFKDERKNHLLDRYYNEMKKNGIIFGAESEKNYRLGAIQTTTAIWDYPFSFQAGKKGFVYHEKYIFEFPKFVQNAWRTKITDGWHICILRYFPILLHKRNFIFWDVSPLTDLDLELLVKTRMICDINYKVQS